MQPIESPQCPHEWETFDDPRFYNLGGFTPGETICRLCGAHQAPASHQSRTGSRILSVLPLALITVVSVLLLPLAKLWRRRAKK